MKKSTTVAAALGVFLVGAVASAATMSFTDEASFAEWFKPAVEKMQFNEIIQGYPDGSFGPANNVTRAELAVMMDRFATAMGMPLKSEPTACTMQYVYGLNLHVQDMYGNPLDEAMVEIEGVGNTYTEEATTGSGAVAVLGEQEGYFNFTVSMEDYTTHKETVKLEKDECHVIPQVRTVTLFEEAKG